MTVVPGDLQGVRAMELRVGDAQRIRGARSGPPLFSALTQRTTRRARTPQSQFHQADPRDVVIGEPNRHALVSLDLEVHGLVAVVHDPRVPDPWADAATQRSSGSRSELAQVLAGSQTTTGISRSVPVW